MSYKGFYCYEGHHDHDNSYTEKHLIISSFQFQRFTPLSSWWNIMVAGRHSTGGADISTSWTAGNMEICVTGHSLSMYIKTSKPAPKMTQFSNKARSPQTRTHLLIVLTLQTKWSNPWVCVGHTFQITTVWLAAFGVLSSESS